MKILLVNKNSKEKQTLTLEEFKIKFNNELRVAINSYSNSEKQKKYLPPFQTDFTNYEFEFYFSLRWNFNNHSMSAWYIERIF
jgi:hypothetical protein